MKLILLAPLMMFLASCGVDPTTKATPPQWCWARIQCKDQDRYPDQTAYRILQEKQVNGQMTMCVDTYSVGSYSGSHNSNCYPLAKSPQSDADCLTDYNQYLKPSTESCKYQGPISK